VFAAGGCTGTVYIANWALGIESKFANLCDVAAMAKKKAAYLAAKKSGKVKGVIGNLICPSIIQGAVDAGFNAIPVGFVCVAGTTVQSAEGWAVSGCESIVPY
jgi:hypothetical protein